MTQTTATATHTYEKLSMHDTLIKWARVHVERWEAATGSKFDVDDVADVIPAIPVDPMFYAELFLTKGWITHYAPIVEQPFDYAIHHLCGYTHEWFITESCVTVYEV